MKFFKQYMDLATDGTESTGMGATTATDVTSDVMSESDALSFLGNYDSNKPEEQTVSQEEQAPAQQEEVYNLDDVEIDMSMFGLPQEETISPAPITEAAPVQSQESQMMQQILERLDNRQEDQELQEDEVSALSELATKMQKAGLLPNGLSEEDKQLLQEAKSMRDEIKQQREAQQQQVEFQSKIDSIDSYSKQLEELIPGYSTPFMMNIVAKINQTNPQAGQQILNNPAMLTSIWKQYGSKAQPQQQNTNIIATNNSQTVSHNDLFEKVRSGKASEADELELLRSM